jgi:hypothetical protein
MSNRMDIKSWRKSRNGKAYAVRIGSTWTNDKGVTYLEFDALPLPDEQGRVSCFLEQPREQTTTGTQGGAYIAQTGVNTAPGTQGFARQMAPGGAGRPAALDGDSIPFEMEWR